MAWKIALCDDEIAVCQKLQSYLAQFSLTVLLPVPEAQAGKGLTLMILTGKRVR